MKNVLFPVLAIAFAHGCAASAPNPEVRRHVSSAINAIPVPAGMTKLYECSSRDGSHAALIVVNSPLTDAHNIDISSGTTEVMKSLRRTGQDHIQLEVVHGDGTREPLFYNGSLQEDLHNGHRWVRAEDIAWPRGLWENRHFQFTWHPDGAHSFENQISRTIDVNVELHLDNGQDLNCDLPADLVVRCC